MASTNNDRNSDLPIAESGGNAPEEMVTSDQGLTLRRTHHAHEQINDGDQHTTTAADGRAAHNVHVYVKWIFVAVILVIILAAVVVTIIVPSVMLTQKQHVNQSTPIKQGDVILLPLNYSIDHSYWWIKSLTISVTNASTIPHEENFKMNASIYQLPCSDLGKHIHVHEHSPDKSVEAIVQYFSNCSAHPGKCILDSYYYFVNAQSAVITYYITLSSYYPGLTKVRIVAFDNPDDFLKFLTDSDESYTPIKELYMNKRNMTFDITSEIVQRPTYLFVGIAETQSNVESFNYTRESLTDEITTTKLVPYLGLTEINKAQSVTKYRETKEVCFLAQMNTTLFPLEANFNIQQSISTTQLLPICISIAGGTGFIVLILACTGTVFLIIKIKQKCRRRGYNLIQ